MKGIPAKIQTKEDILNLQGYIGSEFDTPETRSAILAQLHAIRNTAQHYVFSRVLADELERSGPEPGCRVLAGQGQGGAEIHEFILVDDPGNRFAAMGMTLEELDAVIASISA